MSELGPFLHPDVRRLIEDDRLAPDPPNSVKRRVALQVDRSLGLGGALWVPGPQVGIEPPPPSYAPVSVKPPGLLGWKAMAGAAVAVVVGGVVALSLSTRSPQPSHVLGVAAGRPAVQQVAGASAGMGAPALWEGAGVAPIDREASASPRNHEIDLRADRPAARRAGAQRATAHRGASRRGAGAQAGSPAFDTLAAERMVLDRARAALVRRDGAAALEALRSHQHSFPRGQLLEERESMRVQAFALVHDVGALSAAAERFKRQFPQSMFLPAVEQALESTP